MKIRIATLLLFITVLGTSITSWAYPIQISESEYAEINYGIDSEDVMTDYYHNCMINCLNHMPKGVLQYLETQDWNISLIDTNINHYFNDGGSYMGATHFYEKWIKITTNSFGFHYLKTDTNAEKAYKTVLTHEIGHALDAKYGGDDRFSETDEYKEIYNKEASIFDYTFGTDSESNIEHFAEAYKIFLLYPKRLQEVCPSTYNYMDLLLKTEFLLDDN